jgi:hypothetical protein
VSSAETAAAPPPTGRTVTVALIPKAEQALVSACERQGLSEVDVVNRAISLYDWITGEMAAGRDILHRDPQTRLTQLMRLL